MAFGYGQSSLGLPRGPFPSGGGRGRKIEAGADKALAFQGEVERTDTRHPLDHGLPVLGIRRGHELSGLGRAPGKKIAPVAKREPQSVGAAENSDRIPRPEGGEHGAAVHDGDVEDKDLEEEGEEEGREDEGGRVAGGRRLIIGGNYNAARKKCR